MTRKLINAAVLLVAIGSLGIVASATALSQGQRPRTPMANAYNEAGATQQPWLNVQARALRTTGLLGLIQPHRERFCGDGHDHHTEDCVLASVKKAANGHQFSTQTSIGSCWLKQWLF